MKGQKTARISRSRLVLCYLSRALILLLMTLAAAVIVVFCSLKMICGSTSPAARQMFVTTLLETGQLKFLASWFVDDDEIQKLVDGNSMGEMKDPVDSSLIVVGAADGTDTPADVGNIEKITIAGRTYSGTLLIVHDPATVSLATIYPWRTTGETLDQIVDGCGAVAGINGGIYDSTNNTGGTPYGVVVSHGEIQLNEPGQFRGLVLIGLTEDHILQIIDIDGKSRADTEALIRDLKIRDAVTFQEEASDANNHFVQLIINGEAREMNGVGSGLNPRTVIGQRADGALLLLVTDGRGSAGHLGASASDLIDIMTEYGAVNAANLDGGSSSCMYYKGAYLQTSVTFYYANSSWYLPFAFVVSEE